MTRRIKWIGVICCTSVLSGAPAFAASVPPSVPESGLRFVVAEAKKGNRQPLSGMIGALESADSIRPRILPDTRPVLEGFLGDTDAQVQLLGVRGLLILREPASRGALVKFLNSMDFRSFQKTVENADQREQAMWTWQAVMLAAISLGEIGDASAVPALEHVKDFGRLEWSDPIVESLAKLGGVSAFARVSPIADEQAINRAAAGIARIRDPNSVPALRVVVRNTEVVVPVRTGAVRALSEINTPGAGLFLLSVARDRSYPGNTRYVALLSARKMDDSATTAVLPQLLGDPIVQIRSYALTELVRLQPQAYVARWLDAVMNLRENREFKESLIPVAFNLSSDDLKGHRERLYRCLDVGDDKTRFAAWWMIYSLLGEEPSIVLSGRSSPVLNDIRKTIERRLTQQGAGASSPEEQARTVEEKLHKLVSYSGMIF